MIPELDRYAWIALLCCCFSVCTTRPIDTQKKAASVVQKVDTVDRVTLLLNRIKAAEVQGESLSSAIVKANTVVKKPRVSVRSEREIWIGPYRDSTGGKQFNFEINSHQNNNNNE